MIDNRKALIKPQAGFVFAAIGRFNPVFSFHRSKIISCLVRNCMCPDK